MAISYAGVTLATPLTEDLADVIRDRVTLTEMSGQYASYFPTQFSTFFHNLDSDVPKKVELGSLWWPTGCTRHAVGFYLATDNELQLIRNAVGSGLTSQTLSLTWVDANADGVVVDQMTTQMYMLAPQPLFAVPSLPAPIRQLNLIILVDQRWLFAQTSTGSLTVTDGTTLWTDLYSSLATALGITLVVDPPNAAYGKPPGQFNVKYENAAVFMDGVAYSVGQRFVHNTNGAWRAISAPNSLLVNNNNVLLPSARTVLAGGKYIAADVLKTLPANIQVVFPMTDTTVFAVTSAFSATGHNTPWTYHHSSNYTGSNSAALQTLGNQLASDLLTWNTPVYDQTWNGIVNFVPEGLHDIEWVHRAGRVSTRLTPNPYTDFFVQPLFTGPVEFLRLTSSVPDGNGNFPAFLQKYNPTTRAWVDDVACLYRDANT
jgi:hypothetical protein